MRYVKMFIAGMAFPCFLIPFLLLIAWLLGNTSPLTHPFPHFIPLLWGVWNILYLSLFERIFPGNALARSLLTGGLLGLFVAIYGVFWLHAPTLLGMPHSLFYLPLIVGPILYAICWAFIVEPLNRLLGVHKWYDHLI